MTTPETTHFTCERCNATIASEAVIDESYPEFWNSTLRQLAVETQQLRKDPVPPVRQYHSVHVYFSPQGGTSHMALCGPLHPETELEFFLRRSPH